MTEEMTALPLRIWRKPFMVMVCEWCKVRECARVV